MKSLNFPGRKMRHQLDAISANEANIAKMREEFARTKDPILDAKIARCNVALNYQRKAVKYASVSEAQGVRTKKHSKDRGRSVKA